MMLYTFFFFIVIIHDTGLSLIFLFYINTLDIKYHLNMELVRMS